MKRLLLPLLAALALPTALMADLGGADLPNSGSFSTSNKVYDAWCGQFEYTFKPPKGVDCKVQFKNGRLIVDDGNGITKDQIRKVKLELRCKDTFLLSSCADGHRDKRYRINYVDSKMSWWSEWLQNLRGKVVANKTALITFRDRDTDEFFRNDFEVWLGFPIRKDGPTIKLEDD